MYWSKVFAWLLVAPTLLQAKLARSTGAVQVSNIRRTIDKETHLLEHESSPTSKRLLDALIEHRNALLETGDLDKDCNYRRKHDLLKLLDSHTGDDENKQLYDVIRTKEVELFGRCKSHWDNQLLQLIDSQLSTSTKELATMLFDNLMTISNSRSKHYRRPFSYKQLQRVTGVGLADDMPPRAGIIVYLSRFDTRISGLNLDENMKNLQLSRDKFDQIARQMILAACEQVASVVSPFVASKYGAFKQGASNKIEWPKIMLVWLKSDNSQADEWLAIETICDKLLPQAQQVHSSAYMDSIYKDITGEPETLIASNGALDDALEAQIKRDEELFETNRNKLFKKHKGAVEYQQ